MAKIREVESADVEQVSRLTEAEGWGTTTIAGWDRLWQQNPALASGGFARGWVLEEGGLIGGYVCNIGRLYRYAGRSLRAASAGSLIVLPRFRGLSLQLLLQYARQNGVDLLLNTTAAPNVSQICRFLKFDRIAQPNYDVSYYWILRALPFAAAILRKINAPKFLSIGGALAPAVWLYAHGRHRHRHHLRQAAVEGVSVSAIHPTDIDDAFDGLWERITSSCGRLLAYRTAAFLRWHFAAPPERQWPFLVVARAQGRLIGYVAVVRQDGHRLGLARARFGDVFVEGEDPQITKTLLAAAIDEAGKRGAAMIELVGFPETVRTVALSLKPLALRSEAWPFVYRARDRELHTALARQESWYASLFDGDGSL